MSDSEDSSQACSLPQDSMSVSDQEDDISGRDGEDNMPSAELSSSSPSAAGAPMTKSDVSLSSSSEESDVDQPAQSEGTEQALLRQAQVPTVELDDATLELMSGSYSEIPSPSRRLNIDPVPEEELTEDGTVSKDGDLLHYVTKNLEAKIRLSSPEPADVLTTSSSAETTNKSAVVDSTLLSLLEREARCIASSVDGLTEHLAVSLHTISAVTAQSLCVYKDSVCKTCDAMDANIKSMYQLMAKCEELSKSMAPLYKLSEQVKEIKKLLDIMENLA